MQQTTITRQINLPGLIFIGIGSMVGSGWLFGSFFSAQFAGPSAIFAWIIAALINFIIALPLIEIGTMFPVSGSFIETAYLTHGQLSGFFLAALAWLSMVSTAPIEAQSVLLYVGNYFPALLVKVGHVYALSSLGTAIGIVLLLLFTIINFFTIGFISRFNSLITLWKIVIPILAMIVFSITSFHLQNFHNHGFWVNGSNGIAQALIAGGVIYSLIGFRQIIALAGEVKNPARNIPLAIVISLAATSILYIILQISFIGAIKPAWLAHGWTQLAFPHDKGPFAGLAENLGLIWLAVIFYLDSVISPSGTGLVYTTSTARVIYQAANQHAIPSFFAYLNRFESPIAALILNFVFGILFLLIFTGWQAMSSFIVLCLILSYAITPVNLSILRTQLPNHPRPFRLKGGRVISCLSFILCNCIAYLAGWTIFKPLLVMLLSCLLLFTLHKLICHECKNAHWRHGLWIMVYLVGMAFISYCGTYPGGRNILPHPFDFLTVALWSIFIFWLAWYNRILQISLPEA